MNTFPAILAVSDQVIVGLGTLFVVAAVLIVSILRYKADDFVKFWAAVGTVIGLALGGVGTFFFTKGQVDAKDSQLKTTKLELQTSEKEKMAAGQQITELTKYVTSNPSAAAKKLADISLTLKGEKPLKEYYIHNDWNSPWLYASPAPLISPAPSISVSPNSEVQPKAEAKTSPSAE